VKLDEKTRDIIRINVEKMKHSIFMLNKEMVYLKKRIREHKDDIDRCMKTGDETNCKLKGFLLLLEEDKEEK